VRTFQEKEISLEQQESSHPIHEKLVCKREIKYKKNTCQFRLFFHFCFFKERQERLSVAIDTRSKTRHEWGRGEETGSAGKKRVIAGNHLPSFLPRDAQTVLHCYASRMNIFAATGVFNHVTFAARRARHVHGRLRVHVKDRI